MASTTEEIAIKLGIKVGDFKAALADANASVKKLKKESEGDFFDGFKSAKKSVGDLKNLFLAGGIGTAVVNFFQTAIEHANKSTDATDRNAAAVREFARGFDEIKGISGKVAVATIGTLNRIGSAIGDLINFNVAFAKGGQEGVKVWGESRRLAEETARGAEEVEARLAAVRKKHGAEFLAITKELADIEKKSQDQKLKGLTVFETEANLANKLNELRAKQAKGEGEAIDRRRLALEVAKTALALEDANLAVRKARSAEEEKASEAEKKAFEEYAKAAAERRKDQSLSADKEAELFALRKKNTEAALAQGKADLNIVTLQNQQYLAQMEIVKLRAKLTASLSESEKAQLAQLEKESAELQKQIAQKQQLIASSNSRDPAEAKLLEKFQAQAVALDAQITALTARANVTNTFTDAEAKFLLQLQQQKTSLFEQIDLLERRAAIPNALTAEEEALLVPLREQGRVYTLLIAQLKERAATGNAQTAEEVAYLTALRASSATIAGQIEQLRIRNNAGVGLSEAEKKTLEQYRAQSVALVDVIANLEQRRNSSTGLTEEEAKLLPFYEAENAALEIQIAAMARREGATGNLAAIESAVLNQWEAQQKALLVQIETMLKRKDVTQEQAAADAARLASLLQARDATAAQIEAQLKGTVAVNASLAATVKMTAAEKERQTLLEFQAKQQKQLTELKELDARIQREGINAALQEQRAELVKNLEETNKQVAARVKISLGIKEDLELFKLQSKNAAALTESERLRKDVLELQTKEKRSQIEIETLHGKLMDGTITPAEKVRLATLIKQTEEIGKQIAAKQALADKITNVVQPAEEAVAVEFNGQILKVGDLIDAKTRLALTTAGVELGAEKQVTAEIAAQIEAKNKLKAISGTITNTGDIGGLSQEALIALLTKISRDLAASQAQTLTQRQPTIIEASLAQQIKAIQVELDKRRDFERAVDFLGSGKTEVKFGTSEFSRLQGIFNPDVQKQTATGIGKISAILERTFPEAARNVRNLPTP